MHQALLEHLTSCPRLLEGEDTEARRRGVTRIQTQVDLAAEGGLGGGSLRDGAMTLLGHLLQQPRRSHLLAKVVLRVGGQPEVAVHEGHEGQRGGQPRELSLL